MICVQNLPDIEFSQSPARLNYPWISYTNNKEFEEWYLLGCYAVWLL
jgi:hypothetical protein